MNILFFLKPKGECVYVYDEDSLRQVLDVMEAHRFASIPMISKSTGAYKGTITEGDLLWYIKNQHNLNLHSAKDIRIKDIKRHRDNQPVSVGAKMEDLFSKAVQQNFVPVIDGQKCFIGIITRKNIIEYLCEKTEKK
ncbi:MAG: CBS domain-containing protein [Lachnospiraceae bacterium]|jgi:predicted transcriptional regulator|nr:CBS domain-containing protein [Lachnospiraceae bacterium]